MTSDPPTAAMVCDGRAYSTPDTAWVARWHCPFCDPRGPLADTIPPGTLVGYWASGERCMHCVGTGYTNDQAGFDEHELNEATIPPAVMRRPCVDCAYRPGSPEHNTGILPGPDAGPFYCHHGLRRSGDSYVSPAMLGTRPIGAMVCAGWYAQALGKPLPAEAFRDPGGADRPDAAPTARGA